MHSLHKIFVALLLAVAVFSTQAFQLNKATSLTQIPSVTKRTTATALSERRWNFNEGQGPWGLKKNAEIWNGRVAQMAFVWVFLQELVTGKGIFKGIEEGDWFFIANAGLFGLTLAGLTAWLAIKGEDDYTKA